MIRITVFVLVTVALFFGLAPRPLFTPDWRTSLKHAVSSNDCETVERIVGLLHETHHEKEFFSTIGRLGAEKVCSFGDLDGDFIETAKSIGQGATLPVHEEWLLRFRTRSPIISRIIFFQGGRPYSRDENFRRAEHGFVSASRNCSDKFAPFIGGSSNVNLLSYALKDDTVGVDDVRRIALAQQATCVRTYVSLLALMEASARTRTDFEKVATLANHASLLLVFAPDQAFAFASVQKAVAERGDLPALPTPEFIDNGSLNCDRTQIASRDLWGAVQCSDQGAHGYDRAVRAVYYAARAKRLGWRDVNTTAAAASETLSPECVSAMIALEAEEAADALYPLEFKSLDAPVGPGEPCTPAGGQ